jgi:hypothetical protein
MPYKTLFIFGVSIGEFMDELLLLLDCCGARLAVFFPQFPHSEIFGLVVKYSVPI